MSSTKMSSTKSNPHPTSVALLPAFVYGSALALLLFYGIRSGWISHPLITRYVMGHPVSNIETVMVSIGLVALGLKAFWIFRQHHLLRQWVHPTVKSTAAITVSPTDHPASLDKTTDTQTPQPATHALATAGGNKTGDAGKLDDQQRSERLLDDLYQRPEAHRASLIWQRMAAALKHIQSRKTSEGIDAQLKHLANQDADAQHESYALVRLMVWAIPMLGFLGTVIGISEALGGLNLGADADLTLLIANLKSSLYVAFDTTALALTYGVALMFCQFGLDRVESNVLRNVDQQTEDFVLATFSSNEQESDPVARSISRMGQALLKATFGLVEHQHDLWHESLLAAQDAWISATENSKTNSETYITALIDGAGDNLAQKLAGALETADQRLQHRWEQWQVTLSDNTRTLAQFQQNATSHIEMLEQFFKTSSHLSHQQQTSITHLMLQLDELVAQSKRVQSNQEQEQQRTRQREEAAEKKRAEAAEAARLKAEAQQQQEAENDRRLMRESRQADESQAEFVGPRSRQTFLDATRRELQIALETAAEAGRLNEMEQEIEARLEAQAVGLRRPQRLPASRSPVTVPPAATVPPAVTDPPVVDSVPAEGENGLQSDEPKTLSDCGDHKTPTEQIPVPTISDWVARPQVQSPWEANPDVVSRPSGHSPAAGAAAKARVAPWQVWQQLDAEARSSSSGKSGKQTPVQQHVTVTQTDEATSRVTARRAPSPALHVFPDSPIAAQDVVTTQDVPKVWDALGSKASGNTTAPLSLAHDPVDGNRYDSHTFIASPFLSMPSSPVVQGSVAQGSVGAVGAVKHVQPRNGELTPELLQILQYKQTQLDNHRTAADANLDTEAPAGPSRSGVNPSGVNQEVRSMLVPFQDARIYRTA